MRQHKAREINRLKRKYQARVGALKGLECVKGGINSTPFFVEAHEENKH